MSFVLLGLAACGGGGGDEEAATPATTAEPASTPAGTTVPGFTVTGNLFESQTNGYKVRFPEGWTAKGDFVPASTFSIDAFFAPDVVGDVQPNIAVTCEQVPEGTTLEEYFDAKMDVVREVTQVEPEVSSREVAGEEASVSAYKREDAEPALEKTEVYFVNARCGWNVSLTVPLDRGSEYQSLFEEFLASLELVP
jgi:hypothetical protein